MYDREKKFQKNFTQWGHGIVSIDAKVMNSAKSSLSRYEKN